MEEFSEANCLLGWRAVGIWQFTWQVVWEWLEEKAVESSKVEQAELKAGLDFSCFTLKAISVAPEGDGRSRYVCRMLVGKEDGEVQPAAGEQGGPSRRRGLTSSARRCGIWGPSHQTKLTEWCRSMRRSVNKGQFRSSAAEGSKDRCCRDGSFRFCQ